MAQNLFDVRTPDFARSGPVVTEILRKPRPSRRRGAALRVAAVLVLAAAVGAAVYFFVVRGSTENTPVATGQGAIAISEQGLQTLASLGQPIYWAGARTGDTYELTQSPQGRVFVRYLPPGAAVGSLSIYLTVATYPVANAYAATKTIASDTGSVRIPIAGGGIAFYKTDRPTNIYIAYPGSNYQVEVFDPIGKDARTLVADGGVVKVTPSSTGITVPKKTAEASTLGDLRQLSTRLGRPIYIAGSEPGTTLELTQTPDGRVYVRYLPAGVKVGSQTPYLTIGTYPVKNAYAATKTAAARAGAVKVPVAGGVAFYNTSLPTSVYVAFPGVDEQIEVFDPSAGAAKQTVAALKIHKVS
jgi:hypothetical protein